MKILELTNFSAGACGVWMRVKQEAEMLAEKGYDIKVFSSNKVKGTDETAPEKEILGKIEITRFPAKKLGGESFMTWNFEREALKYKPDVIIAHSYRHPHTTNALKLKKKINCKVFLVTHAPFMSDRERSIPAKIARMFYDSFTGPATLKMFDKIIAITKWEIPILKELGVSEDKIEYIPNGIPREFFIEKKNPEERKILFLGRISPIKDLSTLICAAEFLKDKKTFFEIVGPAEKNYLKELKDLTNKKNLSDKITFSPPIYKIKEKIKKMDSCKIFVLPSKRESMPQSLIEAMAREKIVIASDNIGAKNLIKEGKNGFLFKIGNQKELAAKISLCLKKDFPLIRKEARKSVEQFSWDKIIIKLEKVLRS